MGHKSLSLLPASEGGAEAAGQGTVPHVKPAVDPLALRHKELLRGRFWAHIPAYAEVDEETFLDHKWQTKHTITNVDKLLSAVRGIAAAGEDFLRDAAEAFAKAPMSVRVTPYLLSLIDFRHGGMQKE